MSGVSRRAAGRRGATLLPRAAPAREPTPSGQALASQTPGALGRLVGYLLHHAHVLLFSLGRVCREPFSSLLTAAVIGIALALPSGLYSGLSGLQQLSGDLHGTTELTLYLTLDTGDAEAQRLATELAAWPEIDGTRTITRSAALEEFRRLSGFGEALDALPDNPLPAAVVVRPGIGDPAALEALLARLRGLPPVELAQLDLEWVQRLAAVTELARRAVLVVAALLGLAVLLVVGNTIRLDIQRRREEIVIAKLVGATDAFVRRPFLYTGFWYGLAGGMLAWLLVSTSLWLLSGPAQRLAGLYGAALPGPGLGGDALVLLAGGPLLGIVGSWLAVGRHLGAIEPA
jgi:cell division transport system permease protein